VRNIRPFGWAIIAFNLYFLYALSKGISDLNGDDIAIGLYTLTSLFIWAVINVILYVIFRVTNGRRKGRSCPACDSKVAAGKTVCAVCGFDFMKVATGELNEPEAKELVQNSVSPQVSPSKFNWKIALTSIGGVVLIVIAINVFEGNSGEQSESYWCPSNPSIPAFSTECGNSASTNNNDAIDTSWMPAKFNQWSQDPSVAWRWLENSEYECEYGDGCWGLMVISKNGCLNGLYAELSLLDRNDVQVGYTNDSLSSSLPLQKSKMVFTTYDESADSARLSKISCY
jgi:hypothetical protein